MREEAHVSHAPNQRPAVQLALVPRRALLRLKAWQQDGTPVVLGGRELPSRVGDTLGGPTRVQCIGPGDWLILSHESSSSMLRERLEADLGERGLVLVDVSDALACVEVEGNAARDLLSKGCGLDFHPSKFPVGFCARTRFAHIPVVIECLDALPRFELSVSRSYLGYLNSWLTDAAVEFETP
jgi:sarcosine oxidase, subunit gamma